MNFFTISQGADAAGLITKAEQAGINEITSALIDVEYANLGKIKTITNSDDDSPISKKLGALEALRTGLVGKFATEYQAICDKLFPNGPNAGARVTGATKLYSNSYVLKLVREQMIGKLMLDKKLIDEQYPLDISEFVAKADQAQKEISGFAQLQKVSTLQKQALGM